MFILQTDLLQVLLDQVLLERDALQGQDRKDASCGQIPGLSCDEWGLSSMDTDDLDNCRGSTDPFGTLVFLF